MRVKIINDIGQDIGSVDHLYLVKLGLRHQIVKLIIYCEKMDCVLLQQRSKQDDSCPGMWDSSASGHADAGEDSLSAIVRETKEELGLSVDPNNVSKLLEYNTDEKLKEGILRRMTTIYLYKVSSTKLRTKIDKKEIEKITWIDLTSINKILKEEEQLFEEYGFTKGCVKTLKALLKQEGYL